MAGEKIHYPIYPDLHVPTDLSAHQFLIKYNPDDIVNDKIIYEELSPPNNKLTYGGIRQQAALAAAGLTSEFGLKAGDAVAVIAQNSVNYVLLAHSVMWVGGIIVGINSLNTAYELRHYLSIARAKLIVVDPQFKSRVEEALTAIPELLPKPSVIEMGNSSDSFPSNVLCRGRQPMPPLDLSGWDNRKFLAAVVFSSGTSGKPKGVQWSHYGVIAHLLSNRTVQPETANGREREVFFAPFAHMFGLLGAMLVPSYLGSYCMIMKQFEYQTWITACSTIKATNMKMVPAIAVAIAKDPNAEKLDLGSVNYITCAGATLQTEVIRRLQHLLKGVSILQGYGMSESAVAGLRSGRSLEKAGSVGRILPGMQLRLVDGDFKDVPNGVTGEALIKGPTIFMNYRFDPKSTEEAYHNGWLRTGDALKMDQDGFLWFQDRKKEMIKYKGNQVAPAELEDTLTSHEDVLEAAVCATWDASQQTELPVGYVVLKSSIKESDRKATLESILKWVNGMVSPTKRIRGGLHYLSEIPKNPTGKVMRSGLPARMEMARVAALEARPAKL